VRFPAGVDSRSIVLASASSEIQMRRQQICRRTLTAITPGYARLRRALLTTLIDFAKHARDVRTEEKMGETQNCRRPSQIDPR